MLSAFLCYGHPPVLFYIVQYIQYTFLKIVWSLAKNRTYPGWSRWTGICLVSLSFTDIQYMYVLYVLKIQSHIVASAPAVRGWVFMRRFGLGQCWQLIPFYSISTTDALIVIKKFRWQCLNFHVIQIQYINEGEIVYDIGMRCHWLFLNDNTVILKIQNQWVFYASVGTLKLKRLLI